MPTGFPRRFLPCAVIAAALLAAGCQKQGSSATQRVEVSKPSPPASVKVEKPPAVKSASQPAAPAAKAVKSAPTPVPKKEAAKVSQPAQESRAVQAARKLGTPTSKPVITTKSGLQYIDVEVGDGAAAKAGDPVEVHYTGWLVDGAKFDSSLDRGTPFQFAIGAKQVISGWEEGVAGMKPGGLRKLIIPPNLGYGPGGTGPIPPNATLIFEVELLQIL